MGVGRNLAYTKAFYLRAGGFADHTDIAGGDDDLLVSANADPQRTARVVNPAAWTYSSGKTTWREYFRQRGRHQSTGIRYPRSIGLWLGAVALSHGLFYLLGFYLLFTCYWWLALAAYCLRWLYLVLAYSRPLLKFDAGADAGCGPGHLRGAKKGLGSWAWLALMVVWGDALVGPMYLYLAVGSLWPNRDW
jgi:hypothetical protein